MTNTDLKPKVVLAIGAHPDDLDFGTSGSAAKWAEGGAEVYYLLVTDGSKGSSDRHISSSDLIKLRRDEQLAAGKILGLKEVFFLDYEDGLLTNSVDLKRDIVRVIRQTKPDILVTMDPGVLYEASFGFINHPDHRAAGQAALDAVFPLARDHLSFPELLAEGLEPHKVPHVLLMRFGGDNNYSVDISTTIDKKLEALAAHASQMPNLTQTQQLVRDFGKRAGQASGYDYAEGYLRIDLRD